MRSLESSSALRVAFLKLLEETNSFFALDSQSHEQDAERLNQIRSSALQLAGQASHPSFDRFLAYLLGATTLQADYSLQAIRLLCLAARLLRQEHLPPTQRDELLTAAFLADAGFRPAWLGHHGSHIEIAIYHLRTPGLHWLTPSLEHLIANHHQPLMDPSPGRVLSLATRYLGLVYGAGSDEVGQAGVLPARAIEVLIQEADPGSPGLKRLLKVLSAFPLGSWVQLNSGSAALVIGGHDENPLRPRVGLYRAGPSGEARWEEHDLKSEMTLHIAREIAPSPAQLSLINVPEIFIPGWMGPSSEASRDLRLPPPEIVNAVSPEGGAAPPLPASVRTLEEYRSHLLRREQPRETEEIPAGSSPTAPGSALPSWQAGQLAGRQVARPAGSLPLSRQELLKFYREELSKLRTDWEQKIRSAEQVSNSLKSPLLDSYRRENELMGALLERLEWMEAAAVPPGPAPARGEENREASQATETPDILQAPSSSSAGVSFSSFPFPSSPAVTGGGPTAPFRHDDGKIGSPPVTAGNDVRGTAPAGTCGGDPITPAEDDFPASPGELPEDVEAGLPRIQAILADLGQRVGRDRALLITLLGKLREAEITLQKRADDAAAKSLLSLIAQWRQKIESMDQSFTQLALRAGRLAEEWRPLDRKLDELLKGDSREKALLSWKEQIRPKMAKMFDGFWQELSAHHQQALAHARLINQFSAEARQILEPSKAEG